MEYVRKALYDEIASNSNVITGEEYRELVCGIAQVASDMVVKTLGPYGATTVIDDGTGFTYPSKDGWTCLSKLQFTDPTYNTIFSMLKKISFNSVTTVGDGTTTAMVVANNFLRTLYTRFIPNIQHKGNFRQADFLESMGNVSKELESRLLNNPNMMRVDPTGDFSDIYKIANVATNGNEKFAEIIQKIYQETDNPYIQVTMDAIPETTYEIQHGYRFDARTLNFPAYVNNTGGSVDYKDHPCKVVVFDHNVTFQSHEKIIGALTGLASRDNTEIIILAPYFDDIIASWIDSSVQRLIQNRQRPTIMLVQIPTTMQIHRKTLSDICVLTNGQLFDDAKVKAFNLLVHNQTHNEDEQISDPLLSLEEYSFKNPEEILTRCLGKVQSIIITKTEGFIQDYENTCNQKQYDDVVTEAKENFEAAKLKALKVMGGTLDKEYLFTQMRYIKLRGSTGVIKVGGLSDIQQRCDKDSLDDAVLACRSAFENGYVRGMNLEVLTTLNKMRSEDTQKLGLYAEDIINLLFQCFYLTSIQVIANKQPDLEAKRLVTVMDTLNPTGMSPIDCIHFNLSNPEILDMLIDDPKCLDYNLRTESMHIKGEWEVINSTATDIEILKAVINVLTTVITSTQFLSLTRRFDERVNTERTIQNRLAEDARYTKNKVKATIDAIVDHEDFDMLQGLIGGLHIEGNPDDILGGDGYVFMTPAEEGKDSPNPET